MRRGEPRIGETCPVAGGDGKPTLGEIRLYSKLVGRRTDSTPQSASMHCPPQALGAGHRPSRARDQIRIHRLHRNRYRVASREFIKCTAFATASPSAPTNHSLIARDSPSRWQAKPNPRRGKSKSGRTVQVARTTSFETSFFNPDHRVRADPSRPN